MNLARVFMPFGNNILAANVGSVDTGLDFLEHSFESYMGYPGLSQVKIIPFMDKVTRNLNTSCVAPIPCGTPTIVKDVSMMPFPTAWGDRFVHAYPFSVGNKDRTVDWAVYGTDKLPGDYFFSDVYQGTTHLWHGATELDTPGWMRAGQINFSGPETKALSLRVTASSQCVSDLGNDWPCYDWWGYTACMQCWTPGAKTCAMLAQEKWSEAPPPPPPPVTRNVSIGYGWQSQTSSWVCQARNVTIDGTNYGTWGKQSVSVKMAIGTHTLTADAFCTCTATLAMEPVSGNIEECQKLAG